MDYKYYRFLIIPNGDISLQQELFFYTNADLNLDDMKATAKNHLKDQSADISIPFYEEIAKSVYDSKIGSNQ
ncbi:MAG: hypothetical protein EOP48_13230 [Sphingobacteriales bacterium]|nr:MAG: hypothetical protein EOP48_13230 [Sphingobacteriales bacterium]